MKTPGTNKQRKYEIAAVLLTAAGKFIFMDFLQWKLLFIVVSTLGWGGYVLYRSKKESAMLTHWGFRTDNFKKVLGLVLPFGLVAVAAFFTTGYFLGTINITWHILPILLLYPIWGVIQQFLVIGLMAGNLQDLENQKLSKPVIIVLTALLFGVVHYPYYWLMVGTFALALFYGFIYLKERNVYVMGLFHGWLGGLFFYTVVNRDPFAEVFGRLVH